MYVGFFLGESFAEIIQQVSPQISISCYWNCEPLSYITNLNIMCRSCIFNRKEDVFEVTSFDGISWIEMVVKQEEDEVEFFFKIIC